MNNLKILSTGVYLPKKIVLAEEFDKILEEIPHKPDMIEKKFLIDLTLINYNILKEVGIKEENIIDCCLNSYTEADKLYSYRREKLNAKRNVFIATL